LPPVDVFDRVLPANRFENDSAAFNNHQKHPFGFKVIAKAMAEELPPAKDGSNFHEYTYRTQLIQSKALEAATHAHLLAFPRCMGSLYWQLNDVWPVASWSTLAFPLRPKPAHFTIADAYRSIRLLVDTFPEKSDSTIVSSDGKWRVYMLNLSPYEQNAVVDICLRTLDGKLLKRVNMPVRCLPGEKKFVYMAERPKDSIAKNCRLEAKAMNEKTHAMIAQQNHYFVSDGRLLLQKAEVEITALGPKSIRVFAKKHFVRNVFVESDVESNTGFFDIMPGEYKDIHFDQKIDIASLKLHYLNP
jgi:beta-mannosidase